MSEQPIPHFSFVVRCWRDASGEIHGWLVDVYTGRSHPFRTTPGLVKSIERTLSAYSPFSEETPSKNDEKPKRKEDTTK
jgi:hypothetical protein